MHFPVSSSMFKTVSFRVMVSHQEKLPHESHVSEVLEILHQCRCCGGSRVVWVTPCPSSVLVLFGFVCFPLVSEHGLL